VSRGFFICRAPKHHGDRCTQRDCSAIDVTKGGFAVNNLPTVSIPTSRYNDFLFAPICEDADGMRLSVLSALARLDVDPWEEATKLAAMPKAFAQSTLISTLELLSGRSWKPSEAELVARRLIQLLPKGAEAQKAAAGKIADVHAQRTGYWLVWLVFVMAISFLSPHHQTTTAADQSKSIPSMTSTAQGESAKSTLPAAIVPSR
jgi:hypothetical protein